MDSVPDLFFVAIGGIIWAWILLRIIIAVIKARRRLQEESESLLDPGYVIEITPGPGPAIVEGPFLRYWDAYSAAEDQAEADNLVKSKVLEDTWAETETVIPGVDDPQIVIVKA